MGDQDNIKVDISLGAKAELKTEVPSEASGRAVHALVDAISPFTETLGLVGDHIRAVRSARAVSRLRRAQERLEGAGHPVNTVPDGFLIPWTERTSQSDDQEGLTKLWENLLISASLNYSPRMKSFPSILSELTVIDANFLDRICALDGEYAEFKIQASVNVHLTKMHECMSSLDPEPIKLSNLANIMDEIDEPFVRCRFVELQIGEDTKFRPSREYGLVGSGFSVMMKNGLLEDFTETMSHLPAYRMDMNYVRLTRLGFEFVRAARGLNHDELELAL